MIHLIINSINLRRDLFSNSNNNRSKIFNKKANLFNLKMIIHLWKILQKDSTEKRI